MESIISGRGASTDDWKRDDIIDGIREDIFPFLPSMYVPVTLPYVGIL